jgi:hypothetical protein
MTTPLPGIFCLRDQIRRAAVSVMSNLAEGLNQPRIALALDRVEVSWGIPRRPDGESREASYLVHDTGQP